MVVVQLATKRPVRLDGSFDVLPLGVPIALDVDGQRLHWRGDGGYTLREHGYGFLVDAAEQGRAGDKNRKAGGKEESKRSKGGKEEGRGDKEAEAGAFVRAGHLVLRVHLSLIHI